VGPSLVGRAAESGALIDAARAVADGAGAVVHVVGEAGIGKTSLLAVATDELVRQGVEVRAAVAHETDRRRPMALVHALFPEVPAEPAGDPAAVAIGALEKLATNGPIALVADDVHWADDASLEVLNSVARRVEALGVLLLTAARPQPSPPLLRRLEAALPGSGARLALAPLATSEVAALVEQRVGSSPGPRLGAWLAGTAGNPFLAVELVVGLVDEGRVVVRDGVAELADTSGMPDDLVERLAQRAFLAVPEGELVLRAAAAVPGGVTVEELAALLDQPLGDLLTVALAAVDAAVLVDSGSTLAFRHDLLRRAVLGSTPPSIGRALQRRAATVLIERQADAERIVECLLAASVPGDAADGERLLSVGRSLRRRHPVAAADLLRRALDGIALDDPRSTPVTAELGWALIAAGRAGEVDPLIRDRLRHRTGPLPVELVRLEAIALSFTGRLGEASTRYDGMEQALLLDERGAHDPDTVDAAADLAFLRVTGGRMPQARRLIDWVDGSPTPGSANRRATVSTVRAWLSGVEGAFEAGVGQARAALAAIAAIAQDDGHVATAGSPTLALGLGLDGLGDGDGALAVFRRGQTAVGASTRATPLLQFGAALVLFRRGDWDDTLAEAEAGIVAAEETGLGLGAFWPYSIATLVCCARGRLAEARHWLDRSSALSPPHELGLEWLLYASAALREAEGNTDHAAALLEVLADAVIDAAAPALLLNAAADTVRLALATERPGCAARVAGELDAMTRRTASPVVLAIATWVRGLIASDAGAIEAAAGRLAAHRRRPEAARAHHDAAVAAAGRGATDDARRLAALAFALYDTLGAEHHHRRLRSDLRAHGVTVRPRRSPPRPTRGWASLTASESTIVDLAGQGLANTQIAERLYVSRRTVESHLGRVYAKLELSTRAQLVAAIARRSEP